MNDTGHGKWRTAIYLEGISDLERVGFCNTLKKIRLSNKKLMNSDVKLETALTQKTQEVETMCPEIS